MQPKFILAALAVSLAAVATSNADTVELKNGTKVEGKFAGGTATALNIDTPQGMLTMQTADVAALKFDGAVAAAAVPAAAAQAPAAAPATVPAGTVLTIRMDNQVTSNDPVGKKFTAKLVGDLVAGTTTIAKAGNTVYGQVDQSKAAGRLAGKSNLSISLTGVDVAGKVVPIATTNFAETAAKGEGRRTGRNVAAGALVGNAIDDDGGAGKGAAVGAGVSLIKKGDAVTIPPGALLEFRLAQPATITP